ncbi:LacI family DNA-binding transcriptional regulator [Gramella sp. AN32]|uniref:LacI family DNA-binding transcriptional regulator n=1 Tax=Christiangramia antarctica TaxID=2058158 RepID=A0ABW5X5S0_9FLAO|nr:LacI family DNA-binding transcriptional regulator [Gramella sp. AN32]MCM4154832.1 LacI family transcriptional regulator [Gramella sp. AN32]
MTKLTLKDIAKVFNVSISTASKALNNKEDISQKLRGEIQLFAAENNYRPNRAAQILITKQSKTIGLILPNILNYFFTQVFCGVEKIANERGYKIITGITGDSHQKEVDILNFLGGGSIDGLIVSLAEETQQVEDVKHLGVFVNNNIPIVLFDRVTDKIECDKVIVDDLEGAYRATKHFLSTSCETVAMVTPIGHSSVGKLREKGYRQALEEQGIAYDDKLILRLSPKDDLELLMSFLLNYKKIDGILVLDELTAVEVQRIVKQRGYVVPDDVSIIGFTSGMLSKYVTPSLTVMSQHSSYIGEQAAQILIDRIENSPRLDKYKTKIIKTSLLVRDSTKKL